jgi:hypothetical protein
MAAQRIHGDDTTVPVLAKGRTITGRLWTYVRDDQPFAGRAPPAAVFVRHSRLMSSGFFVEAVAYQQAAFDKLERRVFAVTSMHQIKDKRARLRVAARQIKNGTVRFPRKGCEQLLIQLLGFGRKTRRRRRHAGLPHLGMAGGGGAQGQRRVVSSPTIVS